MLKQGLEWEAAYMLKNYDYIECKRLYDALCSDKYNLIRDDKRFMTVLDKIKIYG